MMVKKYLALLIPAALFAGTMVLASQKSGFSVLLPAGMLFMLVFAALSVRLYDLEKILRLILDISPNCIFIKTGAGRYILANRALINLYGLDSEKEILGKTDIELAKIGKITNYEALRCVEEDKNVLTNQKTKTFPINEFRNPGGVTYLYQVIKTPFNDFRKRSSIIGVSIDITQKKKIENELTKSEIINKMLIESAPYGIFLVDKNGELLTCNHRFKDITGYSLENIKNISFFQKKVCLELVDSNVFSELYQNNRKSPNFEARKIRIITRQDQLKYLSICMALLPNDNAAVFLKDITVEEEVEKEIINAKKKERKRIVTEIHDIIGHSLTSLYMMTEATIDLIGVDNQKAKDLVNHARLQIQNSMFDLKMVLNMLENIDSNDTFGLENLESLIAFFQKLTGVSVTLYIEEKLKKELLDRYIDKCFYRIVQEGITNAAKHSKANSIEIKISEKNQRLVLSVRNDGISCKDIVWGVGLRGIEKRIETLKGSMEIMYGENYFILNVEIPVSQGELAQ